MDASDPASGRSRTSDSMLLAIDIVPPPACPRGPSIVATPRRDLTWNPRVAARSPLVRPSGAPDSSGRGRRRTRRPCRPRGSSENSPTSASTPAQKSRALSRAIARVTHVRPHRVRPVRLPRTPAAGVRQRVRPGQRREVRQREPAPRRTGERSARRTAPRSPAPCRVRMTLTHPRVDQHLHVVRHRALRPTDGCGEPGGRRRPFEQQVEDVERSGIAMACSSRGEVDHDAVLQLVVRDLGWAIDRHYWIILELWYHSLSSDPGGPRCRRYCCSITCTVRSPGVTSSADRGGAGPRRDTPRTCSRARSFVQPGRIDGMRVRPNSAGGSGPSMQHLADAGGRLRFHRGGSVYARGSALRGDAGPSALAHDSRRRGNQERRCSSEACIRSIRHWRPSGRMAEGSPPAPEPRPTPSTVLRRRGDIDAARR